MGRIPLCLLITFNFIVFASSQGHVGPADMIFKTVEECEEPIHKVETTMTQRKLNRTTDVLDITVNTPIDIDDTITLSFHEYRAISTAALRVLLPFARSYAQKSKHNLPQLYPASKMELKGSIMKEGGYKPGSFYMKDNACKTFTLMLGDTFTDMLHAAGVEDCPLPAGNWTAKDYYFDNEKFTVPQVYGEYMMEILLIAEDDEVLSCHIAYYELRPK